MNRSLSPTFFFFFPLSWLLALFVSAPVSAVDDDVLAALGEDIRDLAVCPTSGVLAFSSARDGDLELYLAAPDGSNVERVTEAPGLDARPAWSPDCERLAWVAARPRGRDLDAYREALAEDRVEARAATEIWLADADGEDRRRLTALDADAGDPVFTEDGRRVTFSASTKAPGDASAERAQWIVRVDGAGLARADGAASGSLAADRVAESIQWLAADEREGRGVGTDGLRQAERWLAERFADLGLEPAGDAGYGNTPTFLHAFDAPVRVAIEEGTAVAVDGEAWPADAFVPAPFSGTGEENGVAEAEVVAVGYGITAPDLTHDDYEGVDVEGKIVAVRRFVPPGARFAEDENQRRFGDLRYKAFNAREHGAAGVIIVDLPESIESEEAPEEAPLPDLRVDAKGDAGLPVIIARRDAGRAFFDGAGTHRARLAVHLDIEYETLHNVVARLPAAKDSGSSEDASEARGAILVGAHFDHLGFGGEDTGSLAPEEEAVHNGADDNASGTAALVEIARGLAERRARDLENGDSSALRDVYFAAFSAEESGLLGSSALVNDPPGALDPEALLAMINLDMVGRLRDESVQVLGAASAAEWAELVPPSCRGAELECRLGGDGYGPSDQTPFYAAGVPVLHFFTGTHDDYHRPSDDSGEINALGTARIAEVVVDLASELVRRDEPLTYVEAEAPAPAGDARSFGASLGTIPDYAGDDRPGVPLSGARPGSAADRAGVVKGDLIVELKGQEIRNIYDFVYVLRSAKPGETTTLVVERDGERVTLEVTFDEGRRRP